MVAVQGLVFVVIELALGRLAPAIDGALLALGLAAGVQLAIPLDAPLSRLVGLWRALGLGLLAGVTALAANFLIGQLLAILGLPVTEQDWIVRILADPQIVRDLAPFLIAVGPVAEELFFRGYVYRRLRRLAGLPAALIVSSSAFAAIHGNISGFLVYMAIGLVFALAYERSGRLLAPIVAHMLLNAIVVAVGLWAPQLEPAESARANHPFYDRPFYERRTSSLDTGIVEVSIHRRAVASEVLPSGSWRSTPAAARSSLLEARRRRSRFRPSKWPIRRSRLPLPRAGATFRRSDRDCASCCSSSSVCSR
jgi:membrane protease YdiL (CAAX protease family)